MKTFRRCLLLSFVLCPLSLLGCSGSVSTESATKRLGPARADDSLESAQQVLARSPGPDRAACWGALQQINAHVASHPDKRPPALTDAQKTFLADRFGLTPGDLAEVEVPSYTLLDAPHLEFCFLMRDVARSLEAEALPPAEQAATAFAWTMRQVVPQDGEGSTPPDFVLRRGWGTAVERAYVFLALLQQMGIPGCLLTTPADPPWACGALVEVEGQKEKQLLVFDHRVGLPVPGTEGPAGGPLARAFRRALPVVGREDGRQIATLAQLRKQPELLAQLTVDEKHPYKVGAEQLKDTLVRLAVPLSALSPRMAKLQEDFLPARADVRPAVVPDQLIEAIGGAAGVEGGADAVRARAGTAALLRNFLGEGEGGIDKMGLAPRARLALLPDGALPPQIEELKGTEVGDRIKFFALQQVLLFQIEPGGPRDLVLRGQFDDASKQMVPQLEMIRIQADKLKADPEVYDQFAGWKNKLFEASGKAVEAKEALRKGGSQEAVEAAEAVREQVWKSGMPVLGLLVEGGTAESRRAQVMYQQALCMHEQAERLQARADALARAEPPPDAGEKKAAHRTAQDAWTDAAGWWTSYTQSYPRSPHGIQARLLLAHVREAQGKPDEARAQLEKVAPDFGELNHVSRLYLARWLKAP
jgi:hypothetical protein